MDSYNSWSVTKEQQSLNEIALKAKRGEQRAIKLLKDKHGLRLWSTLEIQGLNAYLQGREDAKNWTTLPNARELTLNGNTFTPRQYAHIGNETNPFYLFDGVENNETRKSWVFAMINEAFQPLFNTQAWEKWNFPTREEIRRQYPFRA